MLCVYVSDIVTVVSDTVVSDTVTAVGDTCYSCEQHLQLLVTSDNVTADTDIHSRRCHCYNCW